MKRSIRLGLVSVLVFLALGVVRAEAGGQQWCDAQRASIFCCGPASCGHEEDRGWCDQCRGGDNFEWLNCPQHRGPELTLSDEAVIPSVLVEGQEGTIFVLVKNNGGAGSFEWKIDILCDGGQSVGGDTSTQSVGGYGATATLIATFTPSAPGECKATATITWATFNGCQPDKFVVGTLGFSVSPKPKICVDTPCNSCCGPEKPCDSCCPPEKPCVQINPCDKLNGHMRDKIWNCHMNTGRSIKDCRGLRDWCRDPKRS